MQAAEIWQAGSMDQHIVMMIPGLNLAQADDSSAAEFGIAEDELSLSQLANYAF